jgi:hypothetical protein
VTTPTPDPEYNESRALEDVFEEIDDLVDEGVVRLSDADVEERLYQALIEGGYAPITAPPDLLNQFTTEPLTLPAGLSTFAGGRLYEEVQQTRAATSAMLADVRRKLASAERIERQAERFAIQARQRAKSVTDGADAYLLDASERAARSIRAASEMMDDARQKAAAIVAAAERDAASILAQALEDACSDDNGRADVQKVPALPVVELIWPDQQDQAGSAELRTTAPLPPANGVRSLESPKLGDSDPHAAGGVPVVVWYPHRTGFSVQTNPRSSGWQRPESERGADTPPAFLVETSALVLLDETAPGPDTPVPLIVNEDTRGAAMNRGPGMTVGCRIGAETMHVLDDDGRKITEHLVAALTQRGHTAVVVRDSSGKRIVGCLVALIKRVSRSGENRLGDR